VLDPRTGKVLPVLIKPLDSSGVSVLRDAATNDEFESTWTLLKKRSDAKGDPRYFHGVFRFLTSNVRFDGNQIRQAGVYDTALPNLPHHADLLAPPSSRGEMEARKKMLLDAISNNFIAVSNFRAGCFSKYGRDVV
jgi:hypothetical protein